MVHSLRAAVTEARRHGDLYFAALVSQDRIEKAFGKARWFWQGWIYTPAVTVWVFLSQCLSPDHSCRDAVARLIAWRLTRGLKPCSAETSAYCGARNNLPEEAIHELVRDTCDLLRWSLNLRPSKPALVANWGKNLRPKHSSHSGMISKRCRAVCNTSNRSDVRALRGATFPSTR